MLYNQATPISPLRFEISRCLILVLQFHSPARSGRRMLSKHACGRSAAGGTRAAHSPRRDAADGTIIVPIRMMAPSSIRWCRHRSDGGAIDQTVTSSAPSRARRRQRRSPLAAAMQPMRRVSQTLGSCARLLASHTHNTTIRTHNTTVRTQTHHRHRQHTGLQPL
jgi:hypothetical protein